MERLQTMALLQHMKEIIHFREQGQVTKLDIAELRSTLVMLLDVRKDIPKNTEFELAKTGLLAGVSDFSKFDVSVLNNEVKLALEGYLGRMLEASAREIASYYEHRTFEVNSEIHSLVRRVAEINYLGVL